MSFPRKWTDGLPEFAYLTRTFELPIDPNENGSVVLTAPFNRRVYLNSLTIVIGPSVTVEPGNIITTVISTELLPGGQSVGGLQQPSGIITLGTTTTPLATDGLSLNLQSRLNPAGPPNILQDLAVFHPASPIILAPGESISISSQEANEACHLVLDWFEVIIDETLEP